MSDVTQIQTWSTLTLHNLECIKTSRPIQKYPKYSKAQKVGLYSYYTVVYSPCLVWSILLRALMFFPNLCMKEDLCGGSKLTTLADDTLFVCLNDTNKRLDVNELLFLGAFKDSPLHKVCRTPGIVNEALVNVLKQIDQILTSDDATAFMRYNVVDLARPIFKAIGISDSNRPAISYHISIQEALAHLRTN